MIVGHLGSSGLSVSKLGLGTMTFGSGDGFAGLRPKVDHALAMRMVAAAVDRGVTLFDSAGRYNDGTAESLLGSALRGSRDRVVISTKDPVLPERDAGPVEAQIRASVEASLGRLDVEHIDIYQAGVVRLDQPLPPIAEGLAAVVEAGLVRHVGVTNLPAWQLDRVALAATGSSAPLVAAQMNYSLLERTIECEYRALLVEHGIGVLAWSPLAGGLLTGKYTRQDPTGGGGRLSSFRLQPLDLDRAYRVIDVLREVASRHRVAPAAVALAWVAAQPLVASVLVGATSMHNLDANLDAAELELSDDEFAALDDASATTRPYPYWLYAEA